MQTINFLNHLPREQVRFNFKQLLLSFVGLLVVCILISVSMMVIQFFEHRELKEISKERELVASQFQQTAKDFPLLVDSIPLEKKLKKLSDELLKKQQEFESISHRTLRKGFSKYMSELSKVTPQGLWLTVISIDQDSKNISIQGKAQKAVTVATFINQLNDSDVFTNLYFDLFTLDRVSAKPYLGFEVATETLLKEEPTEEEKQKVAEDEFDNGEELSASVSQENVTRSSK